MSEADAQAVVLTVIPIFLVAFSSASAVYGRRQQALMRGLPKLSETERRFARRLVRILPVALRFAIIVTSALVATTAELILLLLEALGVTSEAWMVVAVLSTGILAFSLALTAVDEISEKGLSVADSSSEDGAGS